MTESPTSDAADQPTRDDRPASDDEGGNWRMFFWPLMALIVMGVFYFRDQLGGVPDGASSPAVGKAINRVLLDPLDGDADQLTAADLQGRVSLINFWGYWCPPCVAEMPELLELRDEFKQDERFQLVSVACHGVPGQPEKLREQTMAFLKSKDYSLDVHTDPSGATRGAIAQLNDAQWVAYPTTVLVGPDGVVRALWTGYSPAVIREQRAEIAKLLQGS